MRNGTDARTTRSWSGHLLRVPSRCPRWNGAIRERASTTSRCGADTSRRSRRRSRFITAWSFRCNARWWCSTRSSSSSPQGGAGSQRLTRASLARAGRLSGGGNFGVRPLSAEPTRSSQICGRHRESRSIGRQASITTQAATYRRSGRRWRSLWCISRGATSP